MTFPASADVEAYSRAVNQAVAPRGIGASFEQESNDVVFAKLRRPHQRGAAVSVRSIHDGVIIIIIIIIIIIRGGGGGGGEVLHPRGRPNVRRGAKVDFSARAASEHIRRRRPRR